MAWYEPLQRKDGRWDYTCTNDAGTFPIGFCMAAGAKPFYSLPFSEISEVVRGLYGSEERWEAEKAKYAQHLHRYHDNGHASAEDAEECYRLYEVMLHSHRRVDDSVQLKCGICGVWTQARVLVGNSIPYEYALCPACDTEAHVLALHAARWVRS